MSHDQRCDRIKPAHRKLKLKLSVVRQCSLLRISRSSFYFQSKGESMLNFKLMRLMDEQFSQTPFYGYRQMVRWLRRQGYIVARKRVRRLMRKMGLSPIFQAPKTSLRDSTFSSGGGMYTYLLRNKILPVNGYRK